MFSRVSLLLLCTVISFAQVAHPDEPLEPGWCNDLPRPQYKELERVPSADSWFEVYRIRPGVFAIYEPHQFEEVISYLILGKKRSLLFDTGIGVGNIRKVVTQLTPLPVTVLNSHTHYDHVGGNADFEEVVAADTGFTRRNAAGAVNNYGVSDALVPERLCGSLPPGVRRETYKIRPWKITRTIHDKERIDLGGRELEVLLTPGHTPDSLMLLDGKNKLLFTGDMFYLGPIYLYVPETDLAAYIRSMDRAATLVPQLDLLLPAHNVPVADPVYLRRVQHAFTDIKGNRVTPVVTPEYREYKFDGFSLLLSADHP